MEHLHFWSGILVPNDRTAFNRMGLYSGICTVKGVAVIGKLALSQDD
jgi:hypothetical protein